MPEFRLPWMLALLPVIPLAIILWRVTPRPALRFASLDIVRGIPQGQAARARRIGTLLRLLGLIALVVALAGPRWPDLGSRIPSNGIALVMVVDVSRSMDNRDFIWDTELITRLEGMKRVFRLFVDGGDAPAAKSGEVHFAGRKQDLIGLIQFATRPEVVSPLTLEHKGLLQKLDQIEARSLPGESASNPGDALALAAVQLSRANAVKRKVIVLLTDGESNVPPPALTPRQAAQLAGNLKMPIYAIDANPLDPAPGETQSEQARKNLKDIAELTGGGYFRAGDAVSLRDAYERIDQLERSHIKGFEYRRYYEGFVWFGLAALLCWLAVGYLESTVWRTVP